MGPAVLNALSPFLPDAIYALFLLTLLHLTRPAYLAFRKRRSAYGIVFNSVSGLPEALVRISLRDVHGQIVRTAVTDKHGRYKILAPKGEYYIDVVKPGFTFPSIYLTQKGHVSVYDRLLPSHHIAIKDYGMLTKNIPIDPVAGANRSSTFRRGIVLSKGAQNTIAGLSPFVAYVIAMVIQSLIAWAIFCIYTIVLLKRLFSYKPADPPYGTIRNAYTNEPLEGAVVRLLDGRFNKVLETLTTSAKGRYAFFVNRGAYRVMIKKPGFKGVILNFPKIIKDGVVLSKDIRLKRADSVARELPQNGKKEEAEPEPEKPVRIGDLG